MGKVDIDRKTRPFRPQIQPQVKVRRDAYA